MSVCSIFSSYDEAVASAGVGDLVYPVTLGYQVVRVTKCPAAMPPRIPAPVPEACIVRRPSREPVKPETVLVSMPILDESLAYVAVEHAGAKVWVGRSKCFSHAIQGKTITLEVEISYARKRGFIA